MRNKKLWYSIGVFVALILVIPALLPSSYKVERSIIINRPAAAIYPHVADFQQWLVWSPWPKQEPGAQNTFEGTPNTTGHVWHWNGDTVGIGSMTLTRLEPNRIDMELSFKEPFESKGQNYLTFQESNGQTTVTWGATGENPYPVGRIFGLMMDGMLGKDFEFGLAELKKTSEAAPVQ